MTAQAPARGRGRGRPAIGSRRQVVLDDGTVATLTALGQGNLSAGIREAARLVATGERRAPSAAPVNDLTGQRYGALLVEGLAEPKPSANGGRLYRAWRCRCDCGRVEDIVAHRLPSTPSNAGRREVMRACSACRRQRSCVVCGAPFESVAPRTTCSAACKRALTNRDLRQYNRRRAERGS